jgi:ribonuclease HI
MKAITIFTGGESRGNPGPSAIGVYIIDADGKVVQEVAETIGNATDSFAEYQAVMRGLQTAKELFGDKTNEIFFELKLSSGFVKKQLNNEQQITEPGLVPYFIEIHNMRVSSFSNLTFTLISQEANNEVVRLAGGTLDVKH